MADIFSKTLVIDGALQIPWWAEERKDAPLPPCRKGKSWGYDGSACDRGLCQQMGLRCIFGTEKEKLVDMRPLCTCGHVIEYEGEKACSRCRRGRLGLRRGEPGYSYSRELRCTCGEQIPDWNKSGLCGKCGRKKFARILGAQMERKR